MEQKTGARSFHAGLLGPDIVTNPHLFVGALVGILIAIVGQAPARSEETAVQQLSLFAGAGDDNPSDRKIVRWVSKPFISIQFLSPTTQGQLEIAHQAVDAFASSCGCISGSSIEVVTNDWNEVAHDGFAILVDQGGFSHLRNGPLGSLSWAFGGPAELLALFPERQTNGSARLRFHIDENYVVRRAVVVSHYSGRENSLRSILTRSILYGVSPALTVSNRSLNTLVTKTGEPTDQFEVPTPKAFDLLKQLYSERVEPGMTIVEAVKALDQ